MAKKRLEFIPTGDTIEAYRKGVCVAVLRPVNNAVYFCEVDIGSDDLAKILRQLRDAIRRLARARQRALNRN